MTPQVYISDTNIWIDLRNAGLLDAMFDLPLTLCCTDFVLSELKDFDHQHLLARGLVVETLDELATAALFPLMQAHNNSSLADLSCYQLAQQTGHALLTGDGRLRKQAKADGLQVHGALWLLDQMVMHQIIEPKNAATSLQSMLDSGARLPEADYQKRLTLWNA
jgi:predicted nucleic acid-binding protein